MAGVEGGTGGAAEVEVVVDAVVVDAALAAAAVNEERERDEKARVEGMTSAGGGGDGVLVEAARTPLSTSASYRPRASISLRAEAKVGAWRTVRSSLEQIEQLSMPG